MRLDKMHLRKMSVLKVLCCCLILYTIIGNSMIVMAKEAVNTSSGDYEKALILKDLGLLEGTSQGFDLESEASRNQSAVMLVRYLGLEKYAIDAYEGGTLKHPFKDVPDWASPHVAYLYQSGMTKGISSDMYGGTAAVTSNQFATMILRLLGFDDSANDFLWSEAFSFFSHKYDIDKNTISELLDKTNTGISRGQMVRLSYELLYFNYKDMDHEVIDSLYFNEVISSDKYSKYQKSKINESISKSSGKSSDTATDIGDNSNLIHNEGRAIWLSYLDLKPMLLNQSSSAFRNEIEEVILNISEAGFNTLYFQVRPFSDALYKSNIYEWSYIMTGVDGGSLGFDPLEIVIEEAKKKNVRVEAWINPYRIRNDVVKDPLNPDGKMAKMIVNNPDIVISVGNGLTFNPGSDEVQELIVAGVAEIVTNYDVDGIHFDDYFYPGEDLNLDSSSYDTYLNNGGLLSHEEYRRERIDLLIKDVYKTIKNIDAKVSFGVSPQGSVANNYNASFINVEKWINNPGYIDYICPQIYYGFDNETLGFDKVLNKWSQMVKDSKIDLYIGLAGYKIGYIDNWAGSGKEEWLNNEHLIGSMIESSRNINNYGGIAIFRYDSLFNPLASVSNQVDEELQGIYGAFGE